MHNTLPEIIELRTTRPLARKVHNCTVCGHPIAIGSAYSRTVMVDHQALDPRKRLRVVKWHLPFCPQGEA